MPRLDYHHKGGKRGVFCGNCNLYLTHKGEVLSDRFQGSTGKATLYHNVWNIRCAERQIREMLTGEHIVRDVLCKKCGFKLGWMYEYAMAEDQTYKEHKVILENSLVIVQDEIEDPEQRYGLANIRRTTNHELVPVNEPIEVLRVIDFHRRPHKAPVEVEEEIVVVDPSSPSSSSSNEEMMQS